MWNRLDKMIWTAAFALGAACAADPAAETPDPAPAHDPTEDPRGLRPDAPPYAVHGPFWVGYRELEGPDALKVKSWYPALNDSRAAAEEISYRMTLKNPALQVGAADVAVEGHAIADAAVDGSGGPYPLIVFSHGYSLNPEWYSTLVEHYASHGFIVLAPEHAEVDWLEAAEATFDRPIDVKRTLDFAEQLATSGALSGQIDLQHIAVVGHSYGGYTALAIAGARFDLDPFRERCATLLPEDPKTYLCAPFLGKEQEMVARAGLDSPPQGLWPSLSDPRVTAIIPIAGDAYLFNATGLASVSVPMMAIGGTLDFGTPFEWGSLMAYEHASSTSKTLVAFVSADHMIAANPCEFMPWTSSLPPFAQQLLCYDLVWDKLRALDLINHFSTAFLLDVLKGDADAHAALLPAAAQFAGIEYTRAGP